MMAEVKTGKIKWADVCRMVAADDDVKLMFSGAIYNIKKQIAGICLQDAEGDKPAPLKYLSAYWNTKSLASHSELTGVFENYIRTERKKGSAQTFSTLIDEVFEQLGDKLIKDLPPESALYVNKTGLAEILNAEGCPDPIGAELKKVLAGLPSIQGTKPASVGLPRPENHQNKFQGYFCQFPFDFAQIDPLGQMYLCCPQTLPEPAGSLVDNNFMDIWNSDKAVAIRESILDGSFRYCSETTCGFLQSKTLYKREEMIDKRHRDIIDNHITKVEQGPLTINMSYDRSCNLACPSCRTDMVVLKGKARENAETIHDRVVSLPFENVERLIITGSGDPFGSRLFYSFLTGFDHSKAPNLRISLSTNGLLLNAKTWNAICNTAIDKIDVSIDAAQETSYRLNRGGDWAQLMSNLEFIGNLRQSGTITSFELHFVVQANNFREMKEFVAIGKRVHADFICFKQLVNWGTFSEAEYQDRAVQLSSHELHDEFVDLLKDPVFRQPPVYIHDLYHLVNA